MTTTTGDPSSLKTPSTLSGGEFVSRLLAATPPYLYNVPLTPQSFFFSEMLRSFVQGKPETGTSATNSPSSVPRRRKRSWRDARDRPLELTTKDKAPHHHHHHPHHHHHHHHHQQQQQQQQQQHLQQQKDKYFQSQQQQQQQQQQQSQQETHVENRFNKSIGDSTNYTIESKRGSSYEEKTSSFVSSEPLKPVDDNRSEFTKQNRDFYDDSSRRFSSEQTAQQEALFVAATRKIKPEESPQQQQQPGESNKNCNYAQERNAFEERAKIANQELSFLTDQKNKLQDFAGRNFLPGMTGVPRAEDLQQAAKGFGLAAANNVPNPDFLPTGPLWYPPYPTIAQTYPGIDPLHFFIDLRVSGHIWDRKLNERQLPFKSKHCSAFSVPQAKEYNRPLDLTRDEATTSSSSSSRNHAGKNQRGTHFILRNLTETYKDIREMEKNSGRIAEPSLSSKSSSSDEKDYQARILPKNDASPGSSSSRDHEEPEGKDLRALIGLELVVDYVKEPKEDPNVDEEQSPEVGE